MKDHFSSTGVIIALLATTTAAAGQAVDQEDLRRCAAEPTNEAKLACYESLASSGAVPPGSGAMSPATGPAAVPGGGPADINSVTAASATAALPATANPAADAPSPADVPAPVSATAEPEPPAVGPAQVAAMETLGEEYLDRPDDEPEVFTATVARVTRERNGLLYFHFANGQVWRQAEARRFQYPKQGNFDVTITTGMLGDYRLRLAEGKPMTRIRRVE